MFIQHVSVLSFTSAFNLILFFSGEKVLNAIKTFDVDGELIEFVTSDAADTAKIERNKKIAVRTASMTKEKYSRFAEASSYSFFLVGGKRYGFSFQFNNCDLI